MALSSAELGILSQLRSLRGSVAAAPSDADGGEESEEPFGALVSERCLVALAKARPSDMEGLAVVAGAEAPRLRGVDGSGAAVLALLASGSSRLQLELDSFSEEQHAVRLARRLREARARRALRDDVPPYAVVGDAQLGLIARLRPANEQELLALAGMPRTTVQRHGEMLLGCVATYCSQHGMPLGRPSAEAAPAPAAVAPAPAAPAAAAASSGWRTKTSATAGAGDRAGSAAASRNKRRLPPSFGGRGRR